ncbi:MAG: CbtB-domain containing protein [Nitrospirota bacterium]
MEQILERDETILKGLWPTLIVLGMIFSVIVISYGIESIAPGVHDAFHDFRHVVGMACH